MIEVVTVGVFQGGSRAIDRLLAGAFWAVNQCLAHGLFCQSIGFFSQQFDMLMEDFSAVGGKVRTKSSDNRWTE